MRRHGKFIGQSLVLLSTTAVMVRSVMSAMASGSLNSEATAVSLWADSVLGLESGSTTDTVSLRHTSATGVLEVVPCAACLERSTSHAVPYAGCTCTTARHGQDSSTGELCDHCGEEHARLFELTYCVRSYGSMVAIFNHFASHELLAEVEDRFTMRGAPALVEGMAAYTVSIVYEESLDDLMEQIASECGL